MSVIIRAIIPTPRKSCLRHSKRMAYCADCNSRKIEPVRS